MLIQGFEILRPLENSRILKIFHKLRMKYLDLAPKSGQNDTQLVTFSTDFDRVESFLHGNSERGVSEFRSRVLIPLVRQSSALDHTRTVHLIPVLRKAKLTSTWRYAIDILLMLDIQIFLRQKMPDLIVILKLRIRWQCSLLSAWGDFWTLEFYSSAIWT